MKNPTTASRGFPPSLRQKLSGLVLATAFVLLAAPETSAIIYPTWEDSSGNPKRKLRLNIPDSVHAGTVRGIIIHGNPAPNPGNPGASDDTEFAEDAELVALAEHLGFAIIATAHWYKFDYDSTTVTTSAEYNKFVARLAAFATQSGHDELVHAPWIAEGFSNGGQMAYGLNVMAPHKMIAFAANKGGKYNNKLPSAAARATPGLLIAGKNDSPTNKTALRDIFTNNRALGAKWAWVEEEGVGHGEGDSYRLIRPFLAECVKLRYPASVGSPASGPVTLLDLEEEDGWIVNEDTWANGLTDVHAHADETGNPFAFGWVPNQRMAYLYRAFSTYNKAAGPVGGSAIVVDEPLPTELAFNVTPTGSWTSIELFDGATSLTTIASGNPVAITPEVTTGGYHVYHGVITKTGGAKSSTKLRPVLVVGPAAPPEDPPEDPEDPPVEPALKVLVDFGPTATTTLTGDDEANTWNNLTNHALNAALTLVDSAGGATGITLTVTVPFAGNQSTGTTTPSSYVADAVRDSFYFDNGQSPRLRLTGLDPTKVYNFKFLGSRMSTAGDTLIRSTRFTVQGFGASASTVNNATNNIGAVTEVTGILPTAAGEIIVDLTKNTTGNDINNTSSGVGYLGVLEITITSVP